MSGQAQATKPTVAEYESWGLQVAFFSFKPTPVFHAWQVRGQAVVNTYTNCGRDILPGTLDRATMIPLRYARLFARPCHRCFAVPAEATT